MEFFFLTALRIVRKLVNIPPIQRSVMYGIFTLSGCVATTSFACDLVATNKIFLPEAAIFSNALHASSNFTAVLCRSMIWIPFFSMKIYLPLYGFQFLVQCPK